MSKNSSIIGTIVHVVNFTVTQSYRYRIGSKFLHANIPNTCNFKCHGWIYTYMFVLVYWKDCV